MRNSQGPGSHHEADRLTIRTCMTSPLYLEPAGETAGRSAFSDRTGSVRRSRICVGTLPATIHIVRSCISSATGSPESGVRRSTSNGGVHPAKLPAAMADGPRGNLPASIRHPRAAGVSRAKSPGSQRHRHGMHPYVQHRPDSILRHTADPRTTPGNAVCPGRSPTSSPGERSLAQPAAMPVGSLSGDPATRARPPNRGHRGSSAETAMILGQ